jgi:hypothetical protein
VYPRHRHELLSRDYNQLARHHTKTDLLCLAVKFPMPTLVRELKVFNAVFGFIPVAVMDNFARFQWAPKVLLHDVPMFPVPLAIFQFDDHVPLLKLSNSSYGSAMFSPMNYDPFLVALH